ncbi:MAG TPA: DEAD/DEAH box helicase [Candidatus Hydrogenedentes bacterium]|nr:DEAD/DEAH box helicase [Candidatus Hydrogenedentota bacterium]
MTFERFEGLDSRLVRALAAQGIDTPTPIQELAIPPALEGRDLIATAQTGTGKTLAYLLPSLTRLAAEPPNASGPRLLVLTPTRELALQVESVARPLADTLRLTVTVVYGGVGMNAQTKALQSSPSVLIATPGRLLDHMGRGHVRLDRVRILCLDEADRMLDMGFLPDVKRILGKTPADRQTLMFSATFAQELQRLSASFMRDPARVGAEFTARTVDTVRQRLLPVREEEKLQRLLHLLATEPVDSAIIFTRTKARTDRLGAALKRHRITAAVIHGDLDQRQRVRALERFRTGKVPILVATDVAARGLDIDGVSHVINYDIPPTADDYVHRVGRTARANRDGDAITFATPADLVQLETIERALGYNLPRIEYEGAPTVLSLWRPPDAARPGTSRGGRRAGRGLLRRR